MNGKILVPYASRAGSTAEIAEAIGRTLANNGVQVDVIAILNDLMDRKPHNGENNQSSRCTNGRKSSSCRRSH